jgi:hypothetical protein
LLFTVLACGFEPRCALEEDDAMEVRLHKIVRIIEECPLSIHDVSCTELDAVHQLPRFNMPFELGIFIGAAHILKPRSLKRRALVLDRDRYRYQKFLSDIAGQDKANPCAQVLSAALMLRHSFGLEAEARAIESAVERTVADGVRTADIAGSGPAVGTRAMGEAILARL